MFEDEVANFKSTEHFMEVVPVDLFENFYRARYNRNQLNQINNGMHLRIIQSKGVDVEKDFDIKISDLSPDKHNTKFKNFHNSGDGGITFKIDIIINPNESWGYGAKGQKEFVYKGVKYPARARPQVWLNHWYTQMTPLYIVSDAIDVPNGKYIITKNPKRQQDFRFYTVWTLELTTYNPIKDIKWEVNQSLSKYTGKTIPATAKNTKLANCDIKNFIYCKEKTATTQCTRWLQEHLYKIGFLPVLYTTGWYNDEIANAVKTFQQKYQKYYAGMKTDGKIDKVTLDALCDF